MKIIFKFIFLNLISLFAYGQTAIDMFDFDNYSYKGSKSEQAKILLHNIIIWGKVDKNVPILSTEFLTLIDAPIKITREQLKNYIKKNEVNETELGGSIDKQISYSIIRGEKILAKYFVIHDVSTPVYKYKFPSNIDSITWKYNNPELALWKKKKNHIYVMRTGVSTTAVDFSIGWRATKFELKKLGQIGKGLFLHIEMVQPRVYPPGTKDNAPLAPNPGFTEAQYKRLALLFVTAGVRKGDWLIPAFHAVIDQGMDDAHDDPQNFNLEKFTASVIDIVDNIQQNTITK